MRPSRGLKQSKHTRPQSSLAPRPSTSCGYRIAWRNAARSDLARYSDAIRIAPVMENSLETVRVRLLEHVADYVRTAILQPELCRPQL